MAEHKAAEDRQAEIIEAALFAFAEGGFHGTRMDDIARAANLSKGAVYHHFANKEAVFQAVFDRFADRFSEALAGSDGTALERLTSYGTTVLNTLTGDRRMALAWAEFFSHPAARDRLADVYRFARADITNLLRDTPGATHASAMIIAVIEGLVLQAMVGAHEDVVSVWQSQAPRMLSALLA